MARQRDYAAEYRRRVEKALAAGKTRQEGRGHKPPPGRTEASVRRGRALVAARDAAGETPERAAQLIEVMGVQKATEFLRIRGRLREAYRSYEAQGVLDDLLDELHEIGDDYDLDDTWYHYH